MNEVVHASFDHVNGSVSIPECTSGRPHRNRQISVKLLDYTGLPSHLVNEISLTSECSTSSSESLPLSLSAHPSIPLIQEPQHYKEAILIPEWCEAMNIELAVLEANGTWEIVPLPLNKKHVGCKWLYKVKYLSDGQLDRYKFRLVAKGFTQTANMDYFETFAPVAKMTSFRLLLSLAAMHQWSITQIDVTNAFLHGSLDEEVYTSLPPGFMVPVYIQTKYPNCKLVCRLLKSLYELKQAPL